MESSDLIREQYDRTAYPGAPLPLAHPIHLATLGTLFGMNPPAPGASRILELGCGTGGNLIAYARDLPQGAFVGIDLSPAQIEAGQAAAAKEGLRNVELRAESITDLRADFGHFDYIICHGVFSWVPEVVREAILRICRENLSPQGVAYISYNAYPGRRAFEAVRQMMLHHTSRISDITLQVSEARAILELAAKSAPQQSAFGTMLTEEARRVALMPDWFLLHEYLAPINEPFYFSQFNQLAAAAGLQYLGESNPETMLLSKFGQQIGAVVERWARDLIDAEQYMDFFRDRPFRETLLCHADIPLDRGFDAARVRGMLVGANWRPREPDPVLAVGTPAAFEAPGGRQFAISCPLTKAALLVLIECAPKCLPFDELVHAARDRLASRGISPVSGDIDRLAAVFFDGFMTNILQLRCA